MLTKQDLLNQREQIQEDLMSILDGIEDEDRIVNNACQMVVLRMNILISKLESKEC
jgi:hypothetical protein